MLIESPHNERVKLARSLHEAKGRREAGLFLAEGPSVVAEAMAAGAGLLWIAWCEALAGPSAEGVLAAARQAKVEVLELSERAFRALSDARNPQGLAAVARIPAAGLSALETPGERFLGLVLHEIQDPGNLGSMIRSADAFGAGAVILSGAGADAHEPKVVRATAGSLFHLPVVRAQWPAVSAWAAERQVALVAAVAAGGAALDEMTLPPRVAFVIGNEAHGLPPQVLREAALQVRIPMRGRAESLNAAAVAAILLHEAGRST